MRSYAQFGDDTLKTLKAERLKVDTSFSPAYLVDRILSGAGIRVGNVKLSGLKHAVCYFNIDTNVIGMKSGILLATGNVHTIAKPNTSPGSSGIAWDRSKQKKYRSDKDLNKLSAGKTHNHIVLEFDFIPFNNHVTFNFSFASEEYTEYVGSKYNDVFGFFITGPGIRKKNLAIIPGTLDPITINNINHLKNTHLYINNNYFPGFRVEKYPPPKGQKWRTLLRKDNKVPISYFDGQKRLLNQVLVSNFEFDGFTKVLKASCYLEPYKVYHLKIAIGDVADALLMSGVFLEEGSFGSQKDSTAINFREYPDLSETLNFDSILGKREPLRSTDNSEFSLTHINFDVDKTQIPDSSYEQLDRLAAYMLDHPLLKLSITGYTDNRGTKEYNQDLSERRAKSVTDYLKTKGIPEERMIYTGNNFDDPVDDNSRETGRARNRRVELQLIRSE